jgi:uncharacterized protein (DUF169 family)
MPNSFDKQQELNQKNQQTSSCQTICNDCAFHIAVEGTVQCTHPEEGGKNCTTVNFCSSFQPAREIDSPCVSFDFD